MTEHIQTLLDSIALGSIYALMAVGIGLVFGVLRLVNFAYGQLIMAGAYALALTNDSPVLVSILICFAVVLALSLGMELAAFRPLRRASPTTMLVATFAISYLLQSIALVRFGAIGKIIVVIPKLSEPVTIAGVHIRWITIVTILLAIGVFAALTLLRRPPSASRCGPPPSTRKLRAYWSPGECGDHGGCGRPASSRQSSR